MQVALATCIFVSINVFISIFAFINLLSQIIMDSYIRRLIGSSLRVNIPGFGAFLVTNDTGVCIFNSFLKHDDGELAKFVSEQESISVDAAKAKIEAYVQDLNNRLANGETVTIDGVGSFTQVAGNIDFVSSFTKPEAAPASDYRGAASEYISSDAVDIVPDDNTEEPKAAPVYQYHEEKSRTPLIIVIIVLLLLIAAALFFLVFNKDNCVYHFFYGEEEQIEQVEEPLPIIEEAEEAEPDTVPEVVEEPAASQKLQKRYNIVVGTYNTEALAQARVEKLQKMGFEKAFVGVRGKKFVAVIESFDRLPEAESRQEYIVDTYRIESYITNSGE